MFSLAIDAKEVDAFSTAVAEDGKTLAHPYYQEIERDIATLLKAGYSQSLQDAYERAVFANPVTRAKEVARLQTAEAAKVKENLRLDGLKARKAASANVRPRDTASAPTEPVGSMEDSIRSTLREIRERPH